jgi:predicted ATPase
MNLDENIRETVAEPWRPAPPDRPSSFAGGRYLVERELGHGGQKRVFLARDTLLKRLVAIALLTTDDENLEDRKRLRSEAEAMARLGDMPNIVAVHDFGEEAGHPYIVSQYIESGSVASLLKSAEDGRLPLDQALRIGAQVARALAYSHERGVVHGDVKPNNVWLMRDGTAKLGDFGLAVGAELPRFTEKGTLLGTVAYMAPELLTEFKRGPLADLYALGVMLYEMVAGRLPFQDDQQLGIIWQHVNARPVSPTWHNPNIPRALEALILRLLAKAPEDRLRSAHDVATALETILMSGALRSAVSVPQDSRSLERLAGGVFVGREREMTLLQSTLKEAGAGRGRLVLIAGEPGLGKTRLAEQLAIYARISGAPVLVGKCYEGDGAPAFWPWVQIIRSWMQEQSSEAIASVMANGASDLGQIVPEVLQQIPGLPSPPALEPEQARFRLFDAITTFLKNAAKTAPLVLVLDDLHWADKPSLLLLQFLVREMRDTRLLVVGTYRESELYHKHPFSQSLGELVRDGLSERVTLQGLSEEEVSKFIFMTTGIQPPAKLADSIYRRTEGNPFFVSEIVRLLVVEGRMQQLDDAAQKTLEVPRAVRDVISHRLDHLSESCGRVLAVASVIGREFALDVLGSLSDLSEDALLEALEQALAAGLIVEKRKAVGSFAFSHALIRETLYDGLSGARRAQLHRRAGKVFEAVYQYDLESHLAELAHHFSKAAPSGDADKAVDYSIRAADHALRMLAYEEAVEHCQRACQAAELTPITEKRRCELLLKLGEVQVMAGHTTAARDTFLAAASSARGRGDGDQLARAALGVGRGAVTRTSYGRVDRIEIDLLQDALAQVGNHDSALRARLLAQLSLALYTERGQRLRLSDEAVTMARRLTDESAQIDALYSRCVCLEGFEKGGERLALATEIMEVAERIGDQGMVLRARFRRFREFMELGDSSAADREMDIYGRQAQELRQPLYQWLTPFAQAIHAVTEGRFEDGERLMQEAGTIGNRAQERNTELFIGTLTSVMKKLQGRYAELVARNTALAEAYPRLPSWRASLAHIWVKLHKLDNARSEFEQLGFDESSFPRDGSFYSVLPNVIEVCVALRDVERARMLYSLVEPFDGRHIILGSCGVYYGTFAHYLGLLDAMLLRWDEAESHFDEAIEASRRLRARPFECQTQYEYGRMLLARNGSGDREAASSLLAESVKTADELGMLAVSADARAALANV